MVSGHERRLPWDHQGPLNLRRGAGRKADGIMWRRSDYENFGFSGFGRDGVGAVRGVRIAEAGEQV
jgi:hypothetical protein